MTLPEHRLLLLSGALVTAVLLLTGCTGDAVPPPAAPSTPAQSERAAADPSPSSAPSESAACTGVKQPWGACTPSSRQVWMHDEGPIRYAMGTVDLDRYGDPMAYHVVADDVFTVISARFGDGSSATLWSLNCYRRQDTKVYIGDVINLSPYTVKTVGSENGSMKPVNEISGEGCLSQSALPPQD